MDASLVSCASLITDHFRLPEDELLLSSASMDELEKSLASIINNLLNQDMTRLMNAFYKIDLDENEFKRILTSEAPDQISLSLARAVIRREMKKVATRERYRNS